MSDVTGRPLNRVDGPLKVTGAATYAADTQIEGLVHAVMVGSMVAKGRITHIDTRPAEVLPGVLAVLTPENAPRLQPAKGSGEKGRAGQSLLPLQDAAVHYAGQPVALVVAETLEAAREAASLLSVTYKEDQPVATIEQGLPDAFPVEEESSRRGDPEAGLSQAEVRVDAVYTTPVEHHNPMEPHATVASWQGETLTVHDATQGVSAVGETLATAFDIPPQQVRVVSPFLGGGFGTKGLVWANTFLAAMAARHVGQPVKLALTREQMFSSTGYRPATIQHLTLGARRDGALTAIVHDGTSQTSPFDDYTESVGSISQKLYACPNVAVSHRLVRVNTGTPTIMRAPGEAPGSFALECAMDELADALDMDPLELRLRNYAEVDPVTGRPWSSNHLRDCYRLGAERFGWDRRNPEPRSMRDGRYLIGMGMASAIHSVWRSPASARATIQADGEAVVASGTQDLGTGTYTVMTQLAADTLGLAPQQVRFQLGDTSLPHAPTSWGSSTVNTVGPAVHAACTEVRERAVHLACGDPASPLHSCAPDDVAVEDGCLFMRGDRGRGETYTELLSRHDLDRLEAESTAEPGDEQDRFGMQAVGAHFAEVRVDPDLGEIRLSRFLGVFAAGRILNPKTARNQLIGGIVFGIGAALLEETRTDPRLARFVNANLEDYLVPVNADVPPVEILFVEEDDPHVNPIGTKGIGEIGAVGPSAAIANAVFHATGRRIRDLPITLDKLL